MYITTVKTHVGNIGKLCFQKKKSTNVKVATQSLLPPPLIIHHNREKTLLLLITHTNKSNIFSLFSVVSKSIELNGHDKVHLAASEALTYPGGSS